MKLSMFCFHSSKEVQGSVFKRELDSKIKTKAVSHFAWAQQGAGLPPGKALLSLARSFLLK